MKATQISKENGVVKFSIEFSPEEWNTAINEVYKANRNKFTIDGFRRGKAPRKIIENFYGRDIFWDDALNDLLNAHYASALTDLDLEVIDQPSFEAPQIQRDEPVVLTASVEVFPEIDIPEYKGLEIEKIETKVGDKEVDAELEKVQKSQARMETVEDRKSENGDTVIIDFEGRVDGELFDGGSAENFELKLGSGQFIPGFEEQLEGKEAGEEVVVEVTFPENYHSEELAGKPAVFNCTVHEIKKEIVPEIDDELASDVSEFETLAEFREDLLKKLQKQAEETDMSVMKDRTIEKLYEVNDIDAPAAMIRSEIDAMIREIEQSFAYQGITLKKYMEWTGQTLNDIKEQSRADAEKRVKTRIMLKNIARLEGFDASEEEIEEVLKDFADRYDMSLEQAKEMAEDGNMRYFKEDVLTKKVIDFLFDNAKQVEKKAEEAEAAEAEADKEESVAEDGEKAE